MLWISDGIKYKRLLLLQNSTVMFIKNSTWHNYLVLKSLVPHHYSHISINLYFHILLPQNLVTMLSCLNILVRKNLVGPEKNIVEPTFTPRKFPFQMSIWQTDRQTDRNWYLNIMRSKDYWLFIFYMMSVFRFCQRLNAIFYYSFCCRS